MDVEHRGCEDKGHDSDSRSLIKHMDYQQADVPVPPTENQSSMFRTLTRKFTIGRNRSRQAGKRMSWLTGSKYTPVDVASLEYMGFELREVDTGAPAEKLLPTINVVSDPDTAHHDGSDGTEKPSFQDFRKRAGLGAGLVIGAKLSRGPSRLKRDSSGAAVPLEDNVQRSISARKIGQNLADERDEIIAYSEGIDLSSLEGVPGVKRRSTFEDMDLPRTATIALDTTSYFLPIDKDAPNWKPFSMRPPYIVLLAVLAIVLSGLQEWLCQMSIRRQAQVPPTGLISFNDVNEVSDWVYFVWKYLPTFITITYSVMFSVMDFDIRRLEPYYQLSRPEGSQASRSLNLDHLTMFQYFVPFTAARIGQWTVFASTIGNIISATLAPAAQNVALNYWQNPSHLCTAVGCPGRDSVEKLSSVVIIPVWSRVTSAAYITVALSCIYLLWELRRKSGLISDPVGIAGIASMATKSHILQDFYGLDHATRKEIHKKLAHRTYKLYKSSIWQGEWSTKSEPEADSDTRLRSPHPPMLQLRTGVPFILFMVFCLTMIPVITCTRARVIPNALPWLPILIATILKLIWSTFEADVRMIEPFYQLSKGNATPQNSLTLDYQATLYGWIVFAAAAKKHFLVSFVGLTSVLLDVLSVTIGSFSVDSKVFLTHEKQNQHVTNQDQTYLSFWASLVISMTALAFAITVGIIVYMRRHHAFLPREPSTIASVLSFIYASNMLEDFVGTERLTNKQMEKRLKGIGKRYGLGWYKGRDGKRHCAIDEGPVWSRYVHGKSHAQALSGPIEEVY